MNWEGRMLSVLQPIADANLFRMAKCYCDKLAVSNPKELAFFEDGRKSVKQCRECGCDEETHQSNRGRSKGCAFVPAKPMPVDRFYCGHDGWD